MKVSKRGSGMAVRLPARVVGELRLAAGDDVTIEVIDKRRFGIHRTSADRRAPGRVLAATGVGPDDFVLRIGEASERDR